MNKICLKKRRATASFFVGHEKVAFPVESTIISREDVILSLFSYVYTKYK